MHYYCFDSFLCYSFQDSPDFRETDEYDIKEGDRYLRHILLCMYTLF